VIGNVAMTMSLVDGGKSVVFESRSTAELDAYVGPLTHSDIARLDWNNAAGAPRVSDTWSCTEGSHSTCPLPLWAGGTAPSATPPTPAQAVEVVRAWLAGIAAGDPSRTAASMADRVYLSMTLSHANDSACRDARLLITRRDDLVSGAKCLLDALESEASRLRKLVNTASVRKSPPDSSGTYFVDPTVGIPPAPGEVFVMVDYQHPEYGHSYAFCATVALVAGAPAITNAHVNVELIDD
jgi:hypothetical protein